MSTPRLLPPALAAPLFPPPPVLGLVPQRRAIRQSLHDAQLVRDRGRDIVFRQLRWRLFQLLRGGDAGVGERGESGSSPIPLISFVYQM